MTPRRIASRQAYPYSEFYRIYTEIAQVATISAHNNREIGELVAEALERVGDQGIVTVEEAKGTETSMTFVEGMQFDRGYLSAYFVTDSSKMEAVLDDLGPIGPLAPGETVLDIGSGSGTDLLLAARRVGPTGRVIGVGGLEKTYDSGPERWFRMYEFLLDEDGSFYFMEMNTRLQVEHPVTEMITGVDIIKEQLYIASGEKLRYKQSDIEISGHAIECRVYAEDPLRDFAPSPGRITLYVRPGGPGVRLDSGVLAESVVPLEYDPMLAKLIVWAEDRESAIERLDRALSEYQIRGVSTTLTLFRALVGMSAFREAKFHTGFLDELLASGDLKKLHGQQDPEAEAAAVMAAACLATASASRLPGDLFDSGHESLWWFEGNRALHGRFPR